MNMFRLRQAFLITTGLGLAVIGLGYGFNPNFYPNLYGYTLTTVDEVHIFRALCTLYLTLAGFWIWIAFKMPKWHEGALISIMVVMFGLLTGRIFSLVADGKPHALLLFYLGLEIFVLYQAWFIWRKSHQYSSW